MLANLWLMGGGLGGEGLRPGGNTEQRSWQRYSGLASRFDRWRIL